MARKQPLTSLQQSSEINLTPLMDLTFILLITFIITFPLIEQGIVVKLPKGKASELTPEQSRTITVDAQGAVFLDNTPISHEQLEGEMKSLASVQPDLVVMVRADEKILYANVVKILRILHEAKITRMALVTDPAGES